MPPLQKLWRLTHSLIFPSVNPALQSPSFASCQKRAPRFQGEMLGSLQHQKQHFNVMLWTKKHLHFLWNRKLARSKVISRWAFLTIGVFLFLFFKNKLTSLVRKRKANFFVFLAHSDNMLQVELRLKDHFVC